jgi:hypothetical protein
MARRIVTAKSPPRNLLWFAEDRGPFRFQRPSENQDHDAFCVSPHQPAREHVRSTEDLGAFAAGGATSRCAPGGVISCCWGILVKSVALSE